MPHPRTKGCSQSREVATTADSCREATFGSQVQKPRRKGKSGKNHGARRSLTGSMLLSRPARPSVCRSSSHHDHIAFSSVSPVGSAVPLCIEADDRRCLKRVEQLACRYAHCCRCSRQIRMPSGWSKKRFIDTVSRRLSQWVMPTRAVGLSEDAESACVAAAVVQPSPLQSKATLPRSTRHQRLDRTALVPQIPFHGSSGGSG
jgi:hypothetical protein